MTLYYSLVSIHPILSYHILPDVTVFYGSDMNDGYQPKRRAF